MKQIMLLVALTLLSAHMTRSAPIGAVVQGADYDPVKGVTAVHVLNTSHKDISALNLTYYVTLPNREATTTAEAGDDWVNGFVQGKGGFALGTVFTREF